MMLKSLNESGTNPKATVRSNKRGKLLCGALFVLGVGSVLVGSQRINRLTVDVQWRARDLAFSFDTSAIALNGTLRDSVATSKGYIEEPRIPRLPRIEKPNPFPPLEEVVQAMKDRSNLTAGAFALDIAIVGFAKCGTSTMMDWLGMHPEIRIPPFEVRILKGKESWDMIANLYKAPNGTDPSLLRGYKNPSDIIDQRPLRVLREYYPQTKLIVGIRHPILMMESFYNFRVQNQFPMRPFHLMTDTNIRGTHGVHYGRAEYHVHLAKLGLTNIRNSTEEQALLSPAVVEQWKKNSFPPTSPNPIFLYDTAQLSDPNPIRLKGFLQDLQNFLDVEAPFPPPIHYKPGKSHDPELQKKIDTKKIDICRPLYKKQRQRLVEIGSQAQTWILDYFLASPSVYVPNPGHFREILQGYSRDLCSNDDMEKDTVT